MRRARPRCSQKQHNSMGTMQPERLVRLQGLTARPDLNGRIGQLVRLENGEDGAPRAFCQLEHESDGSAVATTTSEQPEMCMDIDPTTACWGQHHRAYVLVAMAVLVPYYYSALTFQLDAQVRARSSVVALLTFVFGTYASSPR